jgi:hypothetical protein
VLEKLDTFELAWLEQAGMDESIKNLQQITESKN